MVDVVIVGAGAAGIAASRCLSRLGISCTILEASPRIGGRAYTDRHSLPGQWEHGCQWFHCADVNPLVPVAEALGWDFERIDRTDRDMAFLDGQWQGAEAQSEYGASIEAAFDAIYRSAEQGIDLPVTEVLPDAGKWQPNLRNLLQLLSSEDPEKISALGYADYADTGHNWIVTGGLGALIERLAENLPIRTGTPVLAVTETAGGVTVETASGALDAKACIVTASTNLLLSGAIRFGSKAVQPVFDQMQNLPCGAYEKVAIAFDHLPFDPEDRLFVTVQPRPDIDPIGFQIVTGDAPKLIAHVGGSLARQLAAAGPGAMIAIACDYLAAAFGTEALTAVKGSATTGWTANPWVRGAYSYAVPGQGHSRKAMIAANIGRIRFAGEAFSLPWYSTVHGAWQSGIDVASALANELASLGRVKG